MRAGGRRPHQPNSARSQQSKRGGNVAPASVYVSPEARKTKVLSLTPRSTASSGATPSGERGPRREGHSPAGHRKPDRGRGPGGGQQRRGEHAPPRGQQRVERGPERGQQRAERGPELGRQRVDRDPSPEGFQSRARSSRQEPERASARTQDGGNPAPIPALGGASSPGSTKSEIGERRARARARREERMKGPALTKANDAAPSAARSKSPDSADALSGDEHTRRPGRSGRRRS